MTSSAEFEEIYDKYKADVFHFAWHLTRDRREAEDMFQEAWLRVIKHLPDKEKRENLKPWLLVIVMNLNRDLLRRKRVRRMFLLGPRRREMPEAAGHEESAMSGSASSSFTDPAVSAEKAALETQISRAIAALPPNQRQVFVLKEVEGLQQAEIAGMLGIPLGTVKSLMHRAVKRLQKELAVYNPKGEKIKCDAKILSV